MNLFKLEKLSVKAYSSSDRSSGDVIGVFEAMFNPDAFTRDYKIEYAKNRGLGPGARRVNYQRSFPSALKIKLLLDGTGVSEYGLGVLNSAPSRTVAERVKQFIKLTFDVNPEVHEPNYLTVKWGSHLTFACRLGAVTVNYTTFDRDGSPLRAELDTTFLSDDHVERVSLKAAISSPDLTHRVVVKEGDTLPLLSRQVYGSPDHYLFVAAANALDDFRDLAPGLELAFPPLPVATP